jgi:hypothetical protein
MRAAPVLDIPRSRAGHILSDCIAGLNTILVASFSCRLADNDDALRR